MSDITVNTLKTSAIQTRAGAVPKASDLGLNVTGTVLQVVESIWDTAVGTTSTTYVTTGHSVSITPSSNSSKIMLSVQGGGHYNNNDVNKQGDWTIYRSIGGGAATNLGGSNYPLWSSYENTFFGNTHSFQMLDSPSTTSAITYTVYMKVVAGTRYYTYNLNNQYQNAVPVHFIAMEIG
jgi:hypothetical protein